LVARHLEAEGIPTVIVGSARDVVEECGVPRFVFADFPLGNPMDKPNDTEMQDATLELALGLLETATAARTTVQTSNIWSTNDGWRDRFMAIDDPEALAAAGAGRRDRQEAGKLSEAARST
jgi:D-proline reductase (dithiol) PrdB